MDYRLESKTSSSRQYTSNVPRGKMLAPQPNSNLMRQVKNKVQNLHQDLQHSAAYGQTDQVKPSESRQEPCEVSTATEDDELIKYMTKIPGYLQQMDKGKNIQERALNFGVLDWKRLEKWKYNERMPGIFHRKVPSSSSNSLSMASRRPTLYANSPQRKQPHPCRLHIDTAKERKLLDGTQKLQEKVKVQDFGDASCYKTVEQQSLHRKLKSSEGSTETDARKRQELNEKPMSVVKAFSKEQDTKFMLGAARAQNVKHNARSTVESDLAHQCPTEPQNIVLLLPKYSSKLSCSDSAQCPESRSLHDRQTETANGSRFSNCISPRDQLHGAIDSEVPNSCPPPIIDVISANFAMELRSATNTSFIESDVITASCPNTMPSSPTLLEAKSSKENKSNEEPFVSIESYKKTELEVGEPAVRGRHPSPNRRFSFSLGRLSRSFSFKDSSAIPQLSSTYTTVKSGPVCSEPSPNIDNCSRDKASTTSRGRSSPLRRLLEPLVKPRVASTHLAEPSFLNQNSALKPMNSNELLKVKNQEISIFQALLQVTIKNGLPFFKLVVENSNDILAAAVKNLPKRDSCLTYAFYSVHEIKKKSGGWKSRGSTGKTSGFDYSTIGQMTISKSDTPDSNAQDSSNASLVTESVLYDIDSRTVELKGPASFARREVAAIIVKNPVQKGNEVEPSSEDTQKNFTHCTIGGNGNSSTTTVILPGGVHGVPNQGAPTSLITRWISGGSCDCGGWDLGCKLQIFTNQGFSNKSLMPSLYSSDRVDLFSQDAKLESKSMFNLAPLKNGFYSVGFNWSFSLLEAFSVCVAVITTRKFSDIVELGSLSEAKGFSEVMARSYSTKTPIQNHGQIPAKYVTSPPPSPVGRI